MAKYGKFDLNNKKRSKDKYKSDNKTVNRDTIKRRSKISSNQLKVLQDTLTNR